MSFYVVVRGGEYEWIHCLLSLWQCFVITLNCVFLLIHKYESVLFQICRQPIVSKAHWKRILNEHKRPQAVKNILYFRKADNIANQFIHYVLNYFDYIHALVTVLNNNNMVRIWSNQYRKMVYQNFQRSLSKKDNDILTFYTFNDSNSFK